MRWSRAITSVALFLVSSCLVNGFSPAGSISRVGITSKSTPLFMVHEGDDDVNEVVACRIVVEGAVQGGYYRSCVRNEAGRFRSLVGTMTPPDDSDTAEIYVEGKRKMVDGFIRWCKRGDVGLSQVTKVKEIIDESPTGLYDGFYVKIQ